MLLVFWVLIAAALTYESAFLFFCVKPQERAHKQASKRSGDRASELTWTICTTIVLCALLHLECEWTDRARTLENFINASCTTNSGWFSRRSSNKLHHTFFVIIEFCYLNFQVILSNFMIKIFCFLRLWCDLQKKVYQKNSFFRRSESSKNRIHQKKMIYNNR